MQADARAAAVLREMEAHQARRPAGTRLTRPQALVRLISSPKPRAMEPRRSWSPERDQLSEPADPLKQPPREQLTEPTEGAWGCALAPTRAPGPSPQSGQFADFRRSKLSATRQMLESAELKVSEAHRDLMHKQALQNDVEAMFVKSSLVEEAQCDDWRQFAAAWLLRCFARGRHKSMVLSLIATWRSSNLRIKGKGFKLYVARSTARVGRVRVLQSLRIWKGEVACWRRELDHGLKSVQQHKLDKQYKKIQETKRRLASELQSNGTWKLVLRHTLIQKYREPMQAALVSWFHSYHKERAEIGRQQVIGIYQLQERVSRFHWRRQSLVLSWLKSTREARHSREIAQQIKTMGLSKLQNCLLVFASWEQRVCLINWSAATAAGRGEYMKLAVQAAQAVAACESLQQLQDANTAHLARQTLMRALCCVLQAKATTLIKAIHSLLFNWYKAAQRHSRAMWQLDCVLRANQFRAVWKVDTVLLSRHRRRLRVYTARWYQQAVDARWAKSYSDALTDVEAQVASETRVQAIMQMQRVLGSDMRQQELRQSAGQWRLNTVRARHRRDLETTKAHISWASHIREFQHWGMIRLQNWVLAQQWRKFHRCLNTWFKNSCQSTRDIMVAQYQCNKAVIAAQYEASLDDYEASLEAAREVHTQALVAHDIGFRAVCKLLWTMRIGQVRNFRLYISRWIKAALASKRSAMLQSGTRQRAVKILDLVFHFQHHRRSASILRAWKDTMVLTTRSTRTLATESVQHGLQRLRVVMRIWQNQRIQASVVGWSRNAVSSRFERLSQSSAVRRAEIAAQHQLELQEAASSLESELGARGRQINALCIMQWSLRQQERRLTRQCTYKWAEAVFESMNEAQAPPLQAHVASRLRSVLRGIWYQRLQAAVATWSKAAVEAQHIQAMARSVLQPDESSKMLLQLHWRLATKVAQEKPASRSRKVVTIKEVLDSALKGKIRPGMVITEINGTAIEMLSSNVVLAKIKSAGRPLTITFQTQRVRFADQLEH